MSAILFDCDGVLIDSEPMGCVALAQAITAAGLPMTPDDAAAIFPGNGHAESLAWMTANGLDGGAVLAEVDRILFAMFEHEVPLIPGIEAVLDAIDVPMAVCSNSMIRRLDLSLGRTPLPRRFGRHVYSAEQVARAKPAPDLALFAAGQLGIRPEDAIFIDDNVHGVACARSAGCLAVGFVGPSDHRPEQDARLRAAGAHHVVHGTDGLLALLRTRIPSSQKMA
ncbi:HAD family hydrolase [Falsirhodobacter deserti]|uniref:HAD family hydrolase n=1 Tax=Falsirhodobacter deserti TaxID=1365611 RepID=UPI000FE4145A|nr:HAD-IA family hydrolase [Falsirhodobacter deserti]